MSQAADVEVWWFVSTVHKSSGKILRRDIDGVVAMKTSGAIKAAENRNPLWHNESFGVRRAIGSHVRECQAISERRTKQLVEFVELMTQ
jgi:hypothetical protein